MENLLNANLESLTESIGIYCLKINNKLYIGSSIDLKRRLIEHSSQLKRNVHCNKHLQNAYIKHKELLFEILWQAGVYEEVSLNELHKLERSFMKELKPKFNIIQDPVEAYIPNRSKTVHKYDSLGNYVCSYESVTAASKLVKMNRSTLMRHLSGKFKRSDKYYWSYEKANHFSEILNSKQKLYRIGKYDLDDNLIKVYSSCSEAAKEHISSRKTECVQLQISSCCRNKVLHVDDFKYMYVE